MPFRKKTLIIVTALLLTAAILLGFTTGIPWKKETHTGKDSHGTATVEIWFFRQLHLHSAGLTSHLAIWSITVTRPTGVWSTHRPTSFVIRESPHSGITSRGDFYYRSHHRITSETGEALIELPATGKNTTRAHLFGSAFDSEHTITWKN